MTMTTLQDIRKTLEALVLVGGDQLGQEVTSVFAADVMSDLLAFGKAGSLLLTRMTSPQLIRTSDILDLVAIVMVRGNVPAQDVLQLAGELNIPILSTRYVLYESVGRLYEMGLRSRIEKVEPDRAVD
jgi:predicted transcriptional regulator